MLRRWLWEPLAVAALNQSPASQRLPRSSACWRKCSVPIRAIRRSSCRSVRCTRCTRNQRAKFIESRRRRGAGQRARACASSKTDGCRRSTSAASASTPRHVIAAVPWFDLGRLFGPSPPAACATSGLSSGDGVDADRDGQSLVRPRASWTTPFVGLPGREMQWVFDKRIAFGGDASHLSLVSSGATRLTSMSRDELTALAAREVEEAIPAARRDRLIRATVVREKHATFSLAPGQPARPSNEDGRPGALPCRRLDRHRAPGHDRKCRRQWTSGRSAIADCRLVIAD